MKIFIIYNAIICLIVLVQFSFGWIPQVLAGAALSHTVYRYWPCKLSLYECCSKEWINPENTTGLY